MPQDPFAEVGSGGCFLVLFGPTGSGKTWEGYGLLAEHAFYSGLLRGGGHQAWLAVDYCEKVLDLRYRDTFLDAGSTSLLMLDDLGAEAFNDRNHAALFRLIDRRLNHRLRTIITTNLEPTFEGLAGVYGDRLADRITGSMTAVPIIAASKRQART